MVVDIRKPLKKFLPHLLKAREDNLNEADTVQRIIKVFEEVLGYDPLGEITRECQIRDKYVDIALKIEGNLRLLVEVKAAGVELRDRHIEQAEHYAAVGNIPWVVLTNGVTWTLYHLSFDEGVEYVKAFSVDLASDCTDEAAELLAVLHRQSLIKGSIDEYWQHKAALRPESIGKAIFSEDTMKLIRREIRRHENILIDEEDLARAIHEMFSTETRELLGPPRIKRKSKARARAKADSSTTASVDPLCQAPPKSDVGTGECTTNKPPQLSGEGRPA
jgi:predicted type IV restriction endonuclease